MSHEPRFQTAPLADLDDWEDFVTKVYPESDGPSAKQRDDYRNFEEPDRDGVREFYRLNHTFQTVDFVKSKKAEFLSLDRASMSIWEALEFLDTLVDDSDPDTDLSQLQHCLQTAEAIRADDHPEWFVLTGLIHDLGKILCLWGEPQWAVVGDTFPVGCRFSERIVYPELFSENPDSRNPDYATSLGIYQEGCGLDEVDMSWGHDEYLYHVVKDYLPAPGLAMIRYHSFYAGHRERAYDHLLSDTDWEMMTWVRKFNPYDLYSKTPNPPNVVELRPYYQDLIDRTFPASLSW